MVSALLRVLRHVPGYGLARNAYHRMRESRDGARLRRPGMCRVVDNGRGNVISCAGARSLEGVSVTVTGDDCTIEFDHEARLEGCTFAVTGSGNVVHIGASSLWGTSVTISGDRNTVTIGDGCAIRSLGIVCEDSANSVILADCTEVAGATELAAIEGTIIRIGEGCLFSGGIHFRTGDSHSITDLEGHRINPSRDIVIGNRVWVGRSVTVLKGASVADASVIGASAVVTKQFRTPHCIVAGNPAKVVREDIDWKVERVPVETNPDAGV